MESCLRAHRLGAGKTARLGAVASRRATQLPTASGALDLLSLGNHNDLRIDRRWLFTRLTANSLNCTVYSCLGTLNIFTLHFAYPIHTGLEDDIPGEAHAERCATAKWFRITLRLRGHNGCNH